LNLNKYELFFTSFFFSLELRASHLRTLIQIELYILEEALNMLLLTRVLFA
jgi:hypothetical protein